MFSSLLGGGGDKGKQETEVPEKVAQTVQAEIGERLWVSTKKDEDYSRMWEVYGVASLSADRRRVFVSDEVTKKIWEVPAEETLNHDDCHGVDFKDLTRMNYLHEASLLNSLQTRYMNNDIYTYFGDTLISINPYADVDGLYTQKVDPETPHVFSIAEKTYSLLRKKKRSQSVVINGDSGAGKTEAAKQIMRHLVSLCLDSSSATTPAIENLVLESTPVLEAFGNSVTLRNDNSSRFGRFIQIIYSDSGDAITGMNTLHFLLEKSRLISRSPGERNYHIFYQLCAAMKSLGFKASNSYNYLLPALDPNNYTGTLPDDSFNFERTRNALLKIGISEETQRELWKVLLSILSLGNVEFVPDVENDLSNVGKCKLAENTKEFLESTAVNLNILDVKRLELALIQRTIHTRNETTVIDLTVEQAKDSRDALAKFLYSAVFDWVVQELNEQSSRSQSSTQKKSRKKQRFIGILDIFGFEDLEVNSFEQVCVNYANELLQKQFDFYIIESERKVFKDEGVEFPDVTLPSIVNSEAVLELLTQHLFNTLEEQCMLRSGTDQGFLTNLEKKKLANHNDKFTLDWKNKNGFIIKHFAGDVSYICTGFVDKNRDALTSNLKTLIQLHCPDVLATQIGKISDSDLEGDVSNKMASKETVLKKFTGDMNNLISTISKTDQVFIRCIKPNLDQASKEWDVKLILSQLEYLGIVQAIRLHQETYPVRREFSFIANKYQQLLKDQSSIEGLSDLKLMRKILVECLGEKSEFKLWQCGHSKVFLGNEVLYKLDSIVNSRRLAKLALMSEEDRLKEVEAARKKQEQELKAARERFERMKKEEELKQQQLRQEQLRKEEEERRQRLEQEALERQQKILADEQRLRDEQQQARQQLQLEEESMRRKLLEQERVMKEETERKLKLLHDNEQQQLQKLQLKEQQLQQEEERKQQHWEEQRLKLQQEEQQRLEQLQAEKENFNKLSKQRQQQLEEEEQQRKAFLKAQEQKLLEEETQQRQLWEQKQQALDLEEQKRKQELQAQEEQLAKEKEQRLKEIQEQEKRINAEKQALLELEKSKLKELALEEEKRNLELEQRKEELAKEQLLLDQEQAKVSALQESQKLELLKQQQQLREEQSRMLELQEQQRTRLEEEQQRLQAQEQRLKQLEEDRVLREQQEQQAREEQRLQREQEEQQRRELKAQKLQQRKELKQQQKALKEDKQRKRAKKQRRKLKLLSATKLQARIRGTIVRSHYKEVIEKRNPFKAILSPTELIVLSSFVLLAKKSKTNKHKVMALTSTGRMIIIHPISLKVEHQAYYDPVKCKAVARGSATDIRIYLFKTLGGTEAVEWKVKDLLNDAATWVGVLGTLTDSATYIREGFTKVLKGRVSRQKIVMPIKFGHLKLAGSDGVVTNRTSRISILSKSANPQLMFLLTKKDFSYTLTWFQNDKDERHTGQLMVDRRMKAQLPKGGSVNGQLNMFLFCLTVKKGKKVKLYTLQGKGKEDRDGWVKVLQNIIRHSKRTKAKQTRQLENIPTLRKGGVLPKKKSFNANDFFNGFQNSDVSTNQNIKELGSGKKG